MERLPRKLEQRVPEHCSMLCLKQFCHIRVFLYHAKQVQSNADKTNATIANLLHDNLQTLVYVEVQVYALPFERCGIGVGP